MDYSQLSDFEINLKVAHIVLGKGNYDWNSGKKEVYSAGIDGGEFLPNGYFDPCNNAADAWPIIESSNISINHDAVVEEWIASHGGVIYQHCRGKRPLRLAMECFLKMQDANHA